MLRSIVIAALASAAIFIEPAQSQEKTTAAAPIASPIVAFVGVSVVPMDGPGDVHGGRAGILGDQTVVVDAGRIVAVGPRADLRVPDGALRVDGAGRFLMPGLADMHVHTWDESDFLLFVANGVTTVRNMFGSPMHLAWRETLRTQERIGPTIYTAGPIVDGDPPVWPGSDVITDPAEAEKLVLAQKAAGYDFLKVYARLKLDVYDAIVVAAKKHGMRVMGHVPDAVGLEHVLDSHQDSVEHLIGFPRAAQDAGSPYAAAIDFRTEFKAWKHVDDAKLGAIAERCVEQRVWNCPTLVVLQKWCNADESRSLLARPEMRYVSPMMRAFWSPEQSYLKDMPAEFLAEVRDTDADRRHAVQILHRAGARILLGTDMGNPFVVPGYAVHEELANLVHAGLSPYEALRAGTSGAAEFMHASEEWGTVSVGKRADLILVEKNPLDDVANAALRVGVMMRGRWLPQAELSRLLDEQAARFSPAAPAHPDEAK